MPDYNGLNTEQLITELNTRDASITTLNQNIDLKDAEILQLNAANEQLQTLLDEKDAEVVSLENSIENIKSSTGTIQHVCELTKEDKKDLFMKLRTTKEGRVALRALIYGR